MAFDKVAYWKKREAEKKRIAAGIRPVPKTRRTLPSLSTMVREAPKKLSKLAIRKHTKRAVKMEKFNESAS